MSVNSSPSSSLVLSLKSAIEKIEKKRQQQKDIYEGGKKFCCVKESNLKAGYEPRKAGTKEDNGTEIAMEGDKQPTSARPSLRAQRQTRRLVDIPAVCIQVCLPRGLGLAPSFSSFNFFLIFGRPLSVDKNGTSFGETAGFT